jgi:hypothetical protein
MGKAKEITIESFREFSPLKLDALENWGFKRDLELEEISPTMATLVYRGKNIAFVFSLDVRDQCVDAEVVKVRNGKLLRNWDGGYSSDIFDHLVKREGYRGNPTGSIGNAPINPHGTRLDNVIGGWLNLLRTSGEKLLRDNPDSLP